MFTRKDEDGLIGARSKMAAAQKLKEKIQGDIAQRSGLGGGCEYGSQLVPVMIGLVLAVALAMLATDGGSLSAWHPTGVEKLDGLLTGSAQVMADQDMNRLVLVLVRGFILFLAAGVAPFLGYVIHKTSGEGRVTPFNACWLGAIIAALLLYLFGDAFSAVLQILADLI